MPHFDTAMAVAKAEAALAKHDAEGALAALGREGGVNVGRARVQALLMNGSPVEARRAAKQMLSEAQSVGDRAGEGRAWICLAEACTALNGPEDAMEAAEKAVSIFKDMKDTTGHGEALCAQAKSYLRLERVQNGIDAAVEAVGLLRATDGHTTLASALELLIQAYSMKANPMAGLQYANKELTALRANGSKQCQAEVLEMIANQYAVLGEPLGALRAGREALDLYVSLQDRFSAAVMLQFIAEQHRANEEYRDAVKAAESSLRIFKDLENKWGEDQVTQTLSLLFVAQGQAEKAPKRPEALKVLKDMVRAIELRSADDLKKAEELLTGKYEGLVTDKDYMDILHPAIQRDPESVEFLEGQGWAFKKEAGGAQHVKTYPHRAFYLHMIMTGMGFGPQFRVVNPYRVGTPGKDAIALSVSQLPETEAWQMEMGYRPGILDSGLQCQGVLGFP